MPKATWIVTDRSGHLKGRPTRDTVPELLLRHHLHALGLRYRLNRVIAKRFKADIAFPVERLVVMVDGCFWHGCPEHGVREFKGPNAATWLAKLSNNRERDVRGTRIMEGSGWSVLRFWECEVSGSLDHVTGEILGILKRVKGGSVS